MAKMRKSPQKQLESEIANAVGNSSRVRIDKMTSAQVKERIQAIRFWDKLKRFECPMCCASDSIYLDSKVDRTINLKCTACTARYVMSTSRSLGARLVVRG